MSPQRLSQQRLRKQRLRPQRRWIGWVAGGLAAALVVTLAVISQGFDSRETPREEPAVWVERAAGQYARVNTETAEIDTVRIAENPSGVVQSGALGLLLTQGFGRASPIDPATPQDVLERAAEHGATQPEGATTDDAVTRTPDDSAAIRTPEGTRQVSAAGSAVLYTTEGGEVYLSRSGADRGVSAPLRLDPLAHDPLTDDSRARDRDAGRGSANTETSTEGRTEGERGAARYMATAAALDESGRVVLISGAEHSVRWYDAARGEFVRGASELPEGVGDEGLQATIAAGRWAALDPAQGKVWLEGRADPLRLDLVGGAKLQASNVLDPNVFVADEGGLWRIDRQGQASRVVRAQGVPAQPVSARGEPAAAWMGNTGALLWTERAGEVPLVLDAAVEDTSDVAPELRTNGTRAVLIERNSGMMWTVPDGKLIPVAQWSLVQPPKQQAGVVVTQDVTEQEPPVAVADEFGVRAGHTALLPVLLNDFDPNRQDVLTIVPEGLGDGLDPNFGRLALLSDAQALTVEVLPDAHGTAQFSYRITDGVSLSEPASVTLTVVDDRTNSAPEWCPVQGCQRSWPSPELAPGGTLTLPILEGWVDPEGDPLVLVSATPVNAAEQIRALVTADGKLAVRHTDPNAGAADVGIRIRVADAQGAEQERELRVRVRPNAGFEFPSMAATVEVGQPLTLKPLERVTGGSGAFQLINAVVQQGGGVTAVNPGGGTVDVSAQNPGSSVVAVTVRDALTEQEVAGVLRVTAVEARPALAVPPLHAFVRTLSDTTVDVLASIPGATSRALSVQSAVVKSGQLRADVIEHTRLRVSGTTADGQPGLIGEVDVVIREGNDTQTARMTVFQVADGTHGVIAVADTATVRAGSVVDIPVLDNDVVSPGERLVLHPEVGAPGNAGELAFASGTNVRYLAPEQPGVYTLSYTTYGASNPEHSDVGQIRVTVIAEGSNRDPQPATVSVRLAPGEHTRVRVPLSGVDPDGDRVRLISIDAPNDPQLTASLVPRSDSIEVEAAASAQRGTHTAEYRVRDAFGGEATGTMRIIVTDPGPEGGAPVVYSDYVRLQAGATEPAVVRPLENDIDPAGGALEIVAVEPNVPGGADSEQGRALANRLDVGDLVRGVVRISGTELGTFSYRYTVRSLQSRSTADGLIVVQVSERVGQQAPAVSDTVLSVRDRAELTGRGVDVVTDRVQWAGGDTSQLKLSLWEGARGKYRVEGNRIVGDYRAEGDLVPFRLAGRDITGTEVETFGFMIVPPLDELRLTLKPGLAPLSVAEGKSIDADVADLVDLGSGDRIVLDEGAFAVQRNQARCEATGGSSLRYTAGSEAPWTDSCTIRVRLSEQQTFTMLPVPVRIMPNAPVVQLKQLTRTIAPGQAETVDLRDMVEWQGGRQGDIGKLRWQVSGGGHGFEVSTHGTEVAVVARADAVTGQQAPLTVSVSGAGESAATLTLRVGVAPTDTPRGATVALQCRVGAECIAPLVGAPGEYDPFTGKPGGGLELVSVDGGSCSYGTLVAAGNSIRVSWPEARGPGGKCTASFKVRDAQQRIGTGTIELDALGVPRAPSSISLAAYDESSVTLQVSLGAAVNAHPAVTGVVLHRDGAPAGSCVPSGASYRCTVGGLAAGERHTFSARAVNAVGESDPTANSVAGWAYKLPEIRPDQISIAQDSAQSPTSGRMIVTVADDDPSIGEIRVTGGGASGRINGSRGTTTLNGVAVGERIEFSVTPISRYAPPIPGVGQTGQAAVGHARVVGLPTISELRTDSADGSRDVLVAFRVGASGDDPGNVSWGVGSGSCTPRQGGAAALEVVTAPGSYMQHTVSVCAQNSIGTVHEEVVAWVGGNPPALEVSVGYGIGATPSSPGPLTWHWTQVTTQPSYVNLLPGATLRYSTGGPSLGAVNPGQTVTVAQCVGDNRCSPEVAVGLRSGEPGATTLTKTSAACIDPAANLAADFAAFFTVSGRSDAPTFRVEGETLFAGWAGWGEARFDGALCPPTVPSPDEPDIVQP